ncbi:recombinase family protein [Streptomyces sp. NPDC059349]|uniref:recombinase family protein n=1 Tax=Streptomyces sp. NPDC059349 TaxID=3346808 RepID=UPI0036CDD453
MPEVDLYLRKSHRDREGVRALTFRAQETRGRQWADDNGYTVRKVWKDNIGAWSDTNRPDFDKALAALADGEVSALWCYAVDRWSRKGAGSVVPLLDRGRRIIADYERLDSAEPRDRRRLIDAAEQAKEYSDLLSYRVKGTKRQQREEGSWVGQAPFGFQIINKQSRKLAHEPVAWRIVLLIFRAAANGVSTRSIARRFNYAGMPSPAGRQWRANMIQKIIHHPVYEGLQVEPGVGNSRVFRPYRSKLGKHVSVLDEGVMPVPVRLVRTARLTVTGRLVPRNGSIRKGRAKYLLTDLVKCVGCGGSMSSTGESYRCGRIAAGAPCPAPAMALITKLDSFVAESFLSRLDSGDPEDELLGIVAKRWNALSRPGETEEAKAALDALKEAEAARERLLRDRQAGIYEGADLLFYELHDEARKTLGEAQERASVHASHVVDISFLLDWSWLQETWDAADLPMRRDLLRLAVARVSVRKAPRPGAKFVGEERVAVEWLAEA